MTTNSIPDPQPRAGRTTGHPAPVMAAATLAAVLLAIVLGLSSPVAAAPTAPPAGSPPDPLPSDGSGTGSVVVHNVVAGVPPVLDRHFLIGLSPVVGAVCSRDLVATFDFAAAGIQERDDIAPGTYCWRMIDAPGMPITTATPGPTISVLPDFATMLTITHTYTDPAVGRNANVFVVWSDATHDDDDPSSFIDPSAYVLQLTVSDGAGAVTGQIECRYHDGIELCSPFVLPIGGRIDVAQLGIAGFAADRSVLTTSDCLHPPACFLILTNRAAEATTTTSTPTTGVPPTTVSTGSGATTTDPAATAAVEPLGAAADDSGALGAGPDPDPADAGDPTADGEVLPRTGAADLVLGAGGSLLIVAGAALVLAARRRRTG